MTMIIDGSTGLEFPDGSDQTSAFTGNAASITSGTLAVARGGTGLSSVGTTGNILQSNGTAWVSAANPPAFTSGTLMLFQQTSAPTGWTKQTTHNDKALRVVSGTTSSGGSVGFTTAFASQAVSGSIGNTTATGSVSITGGSVGATTLSTSQIPGHSHINGTKRIFDAEDGIYGVGTSGTGSNVVARQVGSGQPWESDNTQTIGGGGSHDHSFTAPSGSFTGTAHNHTFTGTAINLAVSYVDLIIASKD
jgi:hypothetical protein